jgi:GNAT superfamily N-acetyltransferase
MAGVTDVRVTGDPQKGTTEHTPPAPDDLLKQAHANYVEFFRVLARGVQGGLIHERGGVTVFTTGIPIPLFNGAFLTQMASGGEPESELRHAVSLLAAAGVPWRLHVAEPLVDLVAPRAAQVGLVKSHGVPGMLLAPLRPLGASDNGAPPLPPGAEIEVVRTAAGLREHTDAAAAGFEMPRDAVAPLGAPAFLDLPDLTYYLARVGGVPAATAMRLTSHGIAGVFTVATLPAYRRRGLGAAITWRAAMDGAQEGCIASYLQASPMGFPVYSKLGYRHVTTYALWGPPHAGEAKD